jgi:dTMP kinase
MWQCWMEDYHDSDKDNLMSKFAGKFIVLDGGDGCGKSTQAKMLADYIRNTGADVVGFRDPGDTIIGEKIRDILLDKNNASMGDNVEVLLYMAARAQLWKEKIGPAIEAGKCVVMDRWLSSTCAYQGCAGGFGVENVIKLGTDCLERVWPDVTIVLDVDLETAAARMNRELDRMELKGNEYHAKVREGFLQLAENHPDKVFKADADKNIDQVHKQVLEIVERSI